MRVARLFKFFSQFNNSLIVKPQRLKDISPKTTYRKFKKTFDKLSFIFDKYHINPYGFMEHSLKYAKFYSPSPLLNVSVFVEYANHLERIKRFHQIYRYYKKSVDNIAKACVESGKSPREFIRDMIIKNRVAYEYVSGRISKYFLVSLQNFTDIYNHLDEMNKKELGIIYSAAGELSAALNDALLFETGEIAKPISSVETAVEKLKQENKQHKEQ